MRVLDLFSGFGMFSLGLTRAGMTTVALCEIRPYARKVLAARYPGVPVYEDVCTLTAERLAADGIAPNVICGGFPCQDLSVAGKGAGLDGKRSGLYREVIRLARDLRPDFIILENVAALLDRGLGIVLGDLAEIGYDAEWHCIPASYVGAWHRRDRVWLVAYPHSFSGQQGLAAQPIFRQSHLHEQLARVAPRWPGRSNLPSPRLCGRADGPSPVVERLHGLGNGLHCDIAERLGRAILSAFERQGVGRDALQVVRQLNAVVCDHVGTVVAINELNEAGSLGRVVGSEELHLRGEHHARDSLNVGGVSEDQSLSVINADGVSGCDKVFGASTDDGGFNLLSVHADQFARGASLEQAA